MNASTPATARSAGTPSSTDAMTAAVALSTLCLPGTDRRIGMPGTSPDTPAPSATCSLVPRMSPRSTAVVPSGVVEMSVTRTRAVSLVP